MLFRFSPWADVVCLSAGWVLTRGRETWRNSSRGMDASGRSTWKMGSALWWVPHRSVSLTRTHTHLCLCSGKVLYKWIIILVITCLRCVWGWNAELTGVCVCVCLGVWWPQRCGRRGVRVKRKGAVQWEVRWTWCYGLRFGLKVVRTWDSCDAAVGR